MTGKQMSIYELMEKAEEKHVGEIPIQPGEKVYQIPDDVWETRCKWCVHRVKEENRKIPASVVFINWYREHVIPCRIMSLAKMNERLGECMSFEPGLNMKGICYTCEHDNMFHDGFCTKEGHAEQRRVCWGNNYGEDEKKIDYYARHRFCTCDDYAER